jgi:hypothetical protein
MSLVMMFTNMSYTLKGKEKKVHCIVFAKLSEVDLVVPFFSEVT